MILKKVAVSAFLLAIFSLLCGCKNIDIKGTAWESKTESKSQTVIFTSDSKLEIMSAPLDKTSGNGQEIKDGVYYYKDKKGKKDNRYVVVYETKEDMENENHIGFLPYYIENGNLKMNGMEYTQKKGE